MRKKEKKSILILLTVICFLCSNLIIFKNQHSIFAAEQWLWPVKGYTGLSRGYSTDHQGIDITGSGIYGKEVRAAKSGTVTSQSSGGKRISESDTYTTSNLYAHWRKPEPMQKFVSSIKITGISNQIAAGKKVKLTASVQPTDATNKSITWKSSNTKIVSVSKDGTLKKATYKITVMKGEVKSISITGSKNIKTGKTVSLKTKVSATSGANKKLKWSSSNNKYATVSSTGKVTALKAGKNKSVKITAMATDGSGKKGTVTIVVIALPRIHFNEMNNDISKEKINLNSKQYAMQYNEEYIRSMYGKKSIKIWKSYH